VRSIGSTIDRHHLVVVVNAPDLDDLARRVWRKDWRNSGDVCADKPMGEVEYDG